CLLLFTNIPLYASEIPEPTIKYESDYRAISKLKFFDPDKEDANSWYITRQDTSDPLFMYTIVFDYYLRLLNTDEEIIKSYYIYEGNSNNTNYEIKKFKNEYNFLIFQGNNENDFVS